MVVRSKGYYNRLLDSLLLEGGDRGETSLRECVVDLLNKFCGTSLNYKDTILHHLDGDHYNNSIDNLMIFRVSVVNNVRKNANSSIHNMKKFRDWVGALATIYSNDYEDVLYLYKGIDVYRSMCVGRFVSKNGKLV